MQVLGLKLLLCLLTNTACGSAQTEFGDIRGLGRKTCWLQSASIFHCTFHKYTPSELNCGVTNDSVLAQFKLKLYSLFNHLCHHHKLSTWNKRPIRALRSIQWIPGFNCTQRFNSSLKQCKLRLHACRVSSLHEYTDLPRAAPPNSDRTGSSSVEWPLTPTGIPWSKF